MIATIMKKYFDTQQQIQEGLGEYFYLICAATYGLYPSINNMKANAPPESQLSGLFIQLGSLSENKLKTIIPKHIIADMQICDFFTLKLPEDLEKNTANMTTTSNLQHNIIFTVMQELCIIAMLQRNHAVSYMLDNFNIYFTGMFSLSLTQLCLFRISYFRNPQHRPKNPLNKRIPKGFEKQSDDYLNVPSIELVRVYGVLYLNNNDDTFFPQVEPKTYTKIR